MSNKILNLPRSTCRYNSYREAYNALPMPLKAWCFENHNTGHTPNKLLTRGVDQKIVSSFFDTSLSSYVDCGFKWSFTKQGHDFWKYVKECLITNSPLHLDTLKRLDRSNKKPCPQ